MTHLNIPIGILLRFTDGFAKLNESIIDEGEINSHPRGQLLASDEMIGTSHKCLYKWQLIMGDRWAEIKMAALFG